MIVKCNQKVNCSDCPSCRHAIPHTEDSWCVGSGCSDSKCEEVDPMGKMKELLDQRLNENKYDLFIELKEADQAICQLCKEINPQHKSMDNGKGCTWCEDRNIRLKLITKIESPAQPNRA